MDCFLGLQYEFCGCFLSVGCVKNRVLWVFCRLERGALWFLLSIFVVVKGKVLCERIVDGVSNRLFCLFYL